MEMRVGPGAGSSDLGGIVGAGGSPNRDAEVIYGLHPEDARWMRDREVRLLRHRASLVAFRDALLKSGWIDEAAREQRHLENCLEEAAEWESLDGWDLTRRILGAATERVPLPTREEYEEIVSFRALLNPEKLPPPTWEPMEGGGRAVYVPEVTRFFTEVAGRACWRWDDGRKMISSMSVSFDWVQRADLPAIRMLLTYARVHEARTPGHWNSMIRGGAIGAILDRLAVLQERRSCRKGTPQEIVEESLKVLERPLQSLDDAHDIECALLHLMDQADGALAVAISEAAELAASVIPADATYQSECLLTVEQWRQRIPELAVRIRAAVYGPDPV